MQTEIKQSASENDTSILIFTFETSYCHFCVFVPTRLSNKTKK